MEDAKRKIVQKIDSLRPLLIEVNNAIFNNPELCYNEHYALDYLTSRLNQFGFVTEKGYKGVETAYRASPTKENSSPQIALISEYDALANIGHACGHSLIAAASTVAAVALKEATPEIANNFTVIGTPAEEGGGGKVKMASNGAFNQIDAAIMIHPSNKTRVTARMYAITDIKFTFLGKASHAAAFADQGINALDGAVGFYNMVAMLRQQIVDSARVHGVFEEGQGAPNIIPEKAIMRFYVRALDKLYFEELVTKIINCAEGAAKASGCRLEVERMGYTYDPFTPNYTIGRLFKNNMDKINLKANDQFSETDEIGSSDIGNLSNIVPTLHPEFAIGDRDAINHSRKFLDAVVSEEGIHMAVEMTKAMAMTVYDLATDKVSMNSAKEEFSQGAKVVAGK